MLTKQQNEEKLNQSKNRKMFVANIPDSITEKNIYDYFIKFGKIETCTILKERLTGKSRGFGFVLFTYQSSAKSALKSPIHIIGKNKIIVKKCRLAKEIQTENKYSNSIDNKNSNENWQQKYSGLFSFDDYNQNFEQKNSGLFSFDDYNQCLDFEQNFLKDSRTKNLSEYKKSPITTAFTQISLNSHSKHYNKNFVHTQHQNYPFNSKVNQSADDFKISCLTSRLASKKNFYPAFVSNLSPDLTSNYSSELASPIPQNFKKLSFDETSINNLPKNYSIFLKKEDIEEEISYSNPKMDFANKKIKSNEIIKENFKKSPNKVPIEYVYLDRDIGYECCLDYCNIY